MKILIVGDIHGQSAQFERLLKKAEFSPNKDKLILLGDLIDRGNDVYGTVRRVADLKNEMGSRLVVIRGSHEKMLLSSAIGYKLLQCMVGRAATVRSFRKHGENLSDYTEWIAQNTVLYHIEQRFQCVHAAVKTEPVSENDEYTLMMDHFSVKKNRYCGKLTLTGHIHLDQPAYFDGGRGKGILLPYDKTIKLPEHGVICLDTGCGTAGRCLTGMLAEEDQYRLIFAL